MHPLQPHWAQPSHSDIQEVIINEAEFTSKSLSKVDLPPFAVFAKMAFPPCDVAEKATYATVQIGRDKHLNLNSDLLYINHSCEPSLIFDTGNLNIFAGPQGLKAGEELTFFYPSTEWDMAQPFDCFCGKPSCRGRISGAKNMPATRLEGVWLNGHIRELLDDQDAALAATTSTDGIGTELEILNDTNGSATPISSPVPEDFSDPTANALKDAVAHAERAVEAAKLAFQSYLDHNVISKDHQHVIATSEFAKVCGAERRGVTNRERSGEMGGDTIMV